MFQLAASTSDIDRTKTLLVWRNRPEVSHTQARLLGGVGKITLQLEQLPLHLLIHIAQFLYSRDNPGKPSQWLIISALYQQVQFRTTDDSASSLEEAESKQNMQSLFFDLFQKNKQAARESANEPSKINPALTNSDLLKVVKKESEHFVLSAATQAACNLTELDNEKQLVLVILFGTYAQKNFTLLYLLKTLQQIYTLCTSRYNKSNAKEKYLKSHADTIRYADFIEQHFSVWIQNLKLSNEKKSQLSSNEITIETELVRDYPKYLSCAREIIFAYAPNSSLRSSPPTQHNRIQCTIS